MKRTLLAALAALLAWTLVASVLNRALRAGWPGYAAVETAMAFDGGMLVARLVVGALASLAGGLVAARIAREAPAAGRAAWIVALALLALFVPVHVMLWAKFPPWYHAVFLASLALGTRAGARAFSPLPRPRPRSAGATAPGRR